MEATYPGGVRATIAKHCGSNFPLFMRKKHGAVASKMGKFSLVYFTNFVETMAIFLIFRSNGYTCLYCIP